MQNIDSDQITLVVLFILLLFKLAAFTVAGFRFQFAFKKSCKYF